MRKFISIINETGVLQFETHVMQDYGVLSEVICTISINRTLKCLNSNNAKKEIKIPENFSIRAAPTVSASPGAKHVCAMNLVGFIKCFGANKYNQLQVPKSLLSN